MNRITQVGDIIKECAVWTKITQYIEDLLLDERATLGDVNKSSLTFQLDAGNTQELLGNSSNSKGAIVTGQEASSSAVRWNRKIDTKIKSKNTEYFFKLNILTLLASIILLPIIAFHIYEYFANITLSNKLSNSMNLIMKVVDMSNVNSLMRQSLVCTLFWNDTVSFQAMKASDAYLTYSRKMKEEIIEGFNDIKDLDFGQEFSARMQKIVGDLTVCEMVNSAGLHTLDCSTLLPGTLDKNLIMYLRGLVSLTDSMFEEYMAQRANPMHLLHILGSRKYRNYLARTHEWDCVRDLYYYMLVPLSSEMMGIIDPKVNLKNDDGNRSAEEIKNKSWEYFVWFAIPVSFVTALLFWIFVYNGLQRVVFDFWHTGLMLPIKLIAKNPLLEKYFKTLEKRAASRFSFF